MFKISDDVIYIGVNDRITDLFEGQYIIPEGISYNSYLIIDEKVAIMDSVDKVKKDDYLANLREALGDRKPDYLIVHHVEPDHASSIDALLQEYPDLTIVASAGAIKMLPLYMDIDLSSAVTVKEGDELELGAHTLKFIAAPMVHWPEVMMSYETRDKILFSADAFGKFGALDADEDWACEARRYYFNIVGKFGVQVQAVLKKVAALDIAAICPLHGPVLTATASEEENGTAGAGSVGAGSIGAGSIGADTIGAGSIGSGSISQVADCTISQALDLYNTWSSYGVESEGVFIAYASMHGNTAKAAEKLAEILESKGCPKVATSDLAREDIAEAIEDAFRYGKIVLAAPTYNGGVMPVMADFIHHLAAKSYQNRTIGFIENGSWAPMAAKNMSAAVSELKNITLAETATIRGALKESDTAALEALADSMM